MLGIRDLTQEPGPGGAETEADRRREERVPARIEVRFANTGQAARAFRAYTRDLSVGGLCLKTDRPYVRGEGMFMSIDVGGERLDLTGVVAWVRGDAIGVRFQGVTREVQKKLDGVLAALRPPPLPPPPPDDAD
jgi:Tfp pilus assembly protein PilZ